jgi:hypothetical protein
MRVNLRALAVALTAAVALAASALGGSTAGHQPVACPRFDASFDLEFGAWGGPGTGIAKRELYAAAVTRGANRLGGYMIYGSATPARATTDPACAATRLASSPRDRRLSGSYTYRLTGHSGWFAAPNGERLFLELVNRTSRDPRVTRGALALTFKCIVPGRLTVAMSNIRGGTFFTARIERELFATAAVRTNNDFTFRVSKRCERR